MTETNDEIMCECGHPIGEHFDGGCHQLIGPDTNSICPCDLNVERVSEHNIIAALRAYLAEAREENDAQAAQLAQAQERIKGLETFVDDWSGNEFPNVQKMQERIAQLEGENAAMKKQLDEWRPKTVIIPDMASVRVIDHTGEYDAQGEIERLRKALQDIKNELGVPQPDYPAPVANAVHIADSALERAS